MLNFLDDYCRTHGLEYDFLYLPMDFRKKDNLGYAFVNFTTSVAAQKFKDILQNYKWATFYCHGRRFTSNKVCDITWARVQGLEALIKRFRDSSFQCDRWDYLPVILNPPRNGYDPNPYPPVILGSLHQRAWDKTHSRD
ncbi:protein terminal ear1 homolog [Phtheirospermum japonicum]|uniref:Protein terminal ear1 homolog n=1 Tax=Phtheirospermum japonicum TaxID=374723 RepID=A0A830CXW8_9LAMI|nr:protein terminal ear1 homolog [Phtheirospermum japonicum]